MNLTALWVEANALGVVDLSTNPTVEGIVNAACSHGLVGQHWAIQSRNKATSHLEFLTCANNLARRSISAGPYVDYDGVLDVNHTQALREHLLNLDDDQILASLE